MTKTIETQTKRATFTDELVNELKGQVRGPLIRPEEPGYQEATLIWNGMVAKRPGLVLRACGTADVVAGVKFAATHDLPFSVKGGGHNIAGTALVEGGLTIDLSLMRGVHVDPAARTVRFQPGCVLGDVDRETLLHGLATPLGFVSETGATGLTLGGGFGYLTRRFGWTVDNLVSAEVVLADGSVVTASAQEHEDLFWALRGGGGNFGVVTSMELACHEVPRVVTGGIRAYPTDKVPDALRIYKELSASAGRELTMFLLLRRAPPAPFVPQDWHGKHIGLFVICHSGTTEQGKADLAALEPLGEPVFDLVTERPYTQLQSLIDATQPKGNHYYWKSEWVSELDDDLLETMLGLWKENPIAGGQIGFAHVGGALNERPQDDGAVGNRDARYAVVLQGMWPPDTKEADAHIAWLRKAWEAVLPFSTGGHYINFETADEGADRVEAAYGENMKRLVEIKSKYDPENLFRTNRNIAPTG